MFITGITLLLYTTMSVLADHYITDWAPVMDGTNEYIFEVFVLEYFHFFATLYFHSATFEGKYYTFNSTTLI